MIELTSLFYHDKMSDTRMKSLYDTIVSCIDNHGQQVKYPNIFSSEHESFSNVLKYVYNDHPEFFYFDINNSIIQYNQQWITITPRYFFSSEETKEYDAKIKESIFSIIKSCFPNGYSDMSLIRREKKLFDWITTNIEYDNEIIEQKKNGVVESCNNSMAWNIYGALVLKKAVCLGIACGFKILCTEIGIPTIVVSGKADEEGHAWNIIEIEHTFYHVDCTWDLRSSISLHIPFARYRYFNLPDSIINSNHQFDLHLLPKCESLEFSMREFCVLEYNEIVTKSLKCINENLSRFAFMCVGFRINSTDFEQLKNDLTVCAKKRMSLYLDSSGCFIGFVL